jgi:hypothetical protein
MMGDDSGCAVVGVLVLFVGFCLFMGGVSLGRNLIRQEAVVENHATWVADENGNVKFVWSRTESKGDK